TTPHSITNVSPRAEDKQTKRSSRLPLYVALGIAAGLGLVFALRPFAAPTTDELPEAGVDAAELVRVQISTLPPDADLYLDDKPISNPFDGELEMDTRP